MLSTWESKPLKHLRLAHFGVYGGALLALLGFSLLIGSESVGTELSTMIMGAGIGLGFFSGYYWACGNNACSPSDF